MDALHLYRNSYTLKKPNPILPAISEKSLGSLEEEHDRNGELRRKINELEGNMRTLEKKYKVNLKEGFENKIKSFRLQAVIERKAFKQTLENAKREMQDHELHEKMKRAQHIRCSQTERLNSISFRLQEKRRKARVSAREEKSEIERKIRMQEEKAQSENKEVHDRIFDELKHNDRKKKYLEKLRMNKSEKQTKEMKQSYLHRIIENEETLFKLKEQLSLLAEEAKTSGPFITI